MKKYLHRTHLEETVMNMLLEYAEKNSPLENFSLKSIKKVLMEKYDVDDKELEKVLNDLKEKDKIEIKEKKFEVFLPSKFIKKFEKLSTPDIGEVIFMGSLFVGFITFQYVLNYLGIKMLVDLSDVTNPLTLYYCTMIPLLIGIVLVFLAVTIYRTLYSKLNFFRELIKFFGGPNIWQYALLLGISITIIYVVLSWFTKFDVNPYFATVLFSSVFIAILCLGYKRSAGGGI